MKGLVNLGISSHSVKGSLKVQVVLLHLKKSLGQQNLYKDLTKFMKSPRYYIPYGKLTAFASARFVYT